MPGIDINVLRQLQQKAKENREKRAKEGGGRDSRMAPIVYVPAGNTYLRFYVDSENNIIRTLFRHKVGQDSAHCVGTCKICRYLGEMEKKYPDFQGAWKLGSREITIAYAWIFECSEENKFVKLKTPVLLMGNRKLGRELNDRIADIDEEEFGKMLDPLQKHAIWELRSSNNGRDFSLSPSFKPGTMDPLPDTLYPLSQCIYSEGQEPTEEQVRKFIAIINDTYENYVKTVDPDDLKSVSTGEDDTYKEDPESVQEEAFAPPKADEKKAASKPPAKKEAPAASAKKAAEDEDRKECFGAHPDGIQPDCLLCPDEGSCETATARAAVN